jgi:rhomboid family GlyGly-CTERM serine protease
MAVGLHVWPAAHAQALYVRSAIFGGEWWRLFTGNFTHFGVSHLAWNLVVLVPTGVWLERRWPRPGRRFMLMLPWAIGLALLIFEPRLEVYAGLSGVVIGLVALLGLQLRRHSPADRWWANALLLLVLIKLAAEGVKSGPLFAQFSDRAIGVVLLAHLAGVVSALLFWVMACRQISSGQPTAAPSISGGEPPKG